MQNFSIHTYTVGYDGKNTVAEMIQYAIKLKWEAIGISNHVEFHENLPYDYTRPGVPNKEFIDSYWINNKKRIFSLVFKNIKIRAIILKLGFPNILRDPNCLSF